MSAPISYDPFSYATQEDPFGHYRALRDRAPVWRHPEHGFVALSRHADVVQALRDPHTFSNCHGMTLESGFEGEAIAIFSLLAMDPPRHDAVRALVARGFTPRRVAALEPQVRELAREAAAQLDGRARCDFIADFAARIPMNVISALLGVPVADRDSLQRWSDEILHREEGATEISERNREASLSLRGYFADWVKDAGQRSRDDLAGDILRAEIDGERLSQDEVIGFLFLLVLAGNETTRNLLGNTLYWLDRFPDVRRRLRDHPELVPRCVEESLRYDAPTQGVARTVLRDAEVAGQTIRAGERAWLILGSANRDERVFPDPDRFDLERDTQASLAFGQGTHFCLGASLARLEARIALEEWQRTVGNWRLDADGARRVRSSSVRGFAALPVEIGRE